MERKDKSFNLAVEEVWEWMERGEGESIECIHNKKSQSQTFVENLWDSKWKNFTVSIDEGEWEYLGWCYLFLQTLYCKYIYPCRFALIYTFGR